MTVSFRRRRPNSSDAILEQDLATIGTGLPNQYRVFLLKFNGGRPSPDIIDVEGLPGGPTDVQCLYGYGAPYDISNIIINYDLFYDRLPASLLPIANDSFNNQFCIVVRGPEVGRIMFADFEYFGDKAITYFVSDDFDTFLTKLREE
jgi:hypothetical protein